MIKSSVIISVGVIATVAIMAVVGVTSARTIVVKPAHAVTRSSATEIKTLIREVTAYNAEVGQTDSEPRIMASGREVYEGAVACPRYIKLGTKVNINGKQFTCEDRMSTKYPDRYDIFMESKAEALAFGRKNLEVTLVR